MPSQLQQTALSYLEGFKTLSPESFLSLLTPNAIHTFAPSSFSPPPPHGSREFASHISHLRSILTSFPVFPKEIFVNEEMRQVTIWATSQTDFKDEVKDDGIPEEKWCYRGEYIFILSMDESGEKIERVLEFVDSKGTEELRGLIARARRTLHMKGGEPV